ncbi:lipopolysaccharide biosynthesis protein [Lichenibacterium minor]|uniref:Lipopolysaccharide biosynthesis protein n=2 Tax=Lichenibacterium minor TaxID=2316528 RepID=A0A4Q2U8I0_9HYPH|nr:lipopolysaccharide biosynthesis protein [Lichenibacterium minor]
MRSELDEGRAASPPVGRELDVGALGRAISARRWWILGPALACFVGALLFVSLVSPRYTAESKVLVENGENYFTRPDRSDQLATTLPDDETVQSQIQLIQSRDIARRAIRRLDLKGNAEFDPLAKGVGVLSRIAILLGLERDPTATSPEDRILSNYYDRLTVYSVPKSRVIAVEFTATDPDLAARAANTVAELFIEAQSAAKRDSASSAAASLASLVTDLRGRVADAEAKADAYRTQSGLLQGSNNANISTQQLGDLNTQLAQARTAQADSQAKAKVIKAMIAQNRVGEIPDVANNEFIRRLSEQRATLKAEIALQTRTLLPGHPHMQELNAQMADVDAQLRTAGEKMARTLENDGHIAAGRVENLLAALDAQKKTVGTAGVDQVRLNGLDSQARLLKDQLEFNTAKYQEAVARENAASTPADARVISRAVPPQLPSFPKKVPIIAIATIAGLVLSLGVLVSRELLSGRAFEEGETESPTVATAVREGRPVVTEAAREASGEASLQAALEALRGCRAQNHAARALVVPSAAGTEAPAAVIALARRLCAEGRTILVDCNAGRPAVQPRHLSLDSYGATDAAPLGLGELLAGGASFAEVIHRDSQSRLHVVPTGALAGTAEAFDAVGLVLDALGETYDYVVLHAPGASDPVTLRLAPDCDAVVMVHGPEAGAADLDEARAAVSRAGGPAIVHGVPAAALEPRAAVRRAA